MPAILRLVDDSIWAGPSEKWTKLISHVLPLRVTLDCNGGIYTAEIEQTTYAHTQLNPISGAKSTWLELLKNDESKGTPIRWTAIGTKDGSTVVERGDWGLLKSGRSGRAELTGAFQFAPEVIRLFVGNPSFIEIQLLTGRPIPWILDGPGPAEDQVFGGEWDVLCLDMRGPHEDVDFHQRWNDWYRESGLVQAFRTIVFYSSQAAVDAGQYGDLFLSPDGLNQLGLFDTESAHPVLDACRKKLHWRASDRTQDDSLVLPSSPEVVSAWRNLRRAAELDGGVFIEGASGTGKTATARLIHRWSGRTPMRFVHANCAEMTAELGKDELFGHVKGAFTGAEAPKLGLLTLADTGTLFLDEIHKLDPKLQGLLLKVLDRGRFLPQGAVRELASDFRVICASNDPQAAGTKVQEDLRNRLFHTRIRLPGITEYPADDFRRLVEVCWEQLKDEVELYFQNNGNASQPSEGIGDSGFDERLKVYNDRVPASNLLASARAKRFDTLSLAEDAFMFLLEHRDQLASSNVRGLVAWLRRAMLQCPSDVMEICGKILDQCSPEAVGLVSIRPPASPEPIVSEVQLAQVLAKCFGVESDCDVDFNLFCQDIQTSLDNLVRARLLNINDDQLIPFLHDTFQQLRKTAKSRKLRIVRPERDADAKSADVFHIQKDAYRWMFEAALPAFGADRVDERMERVKELLKISTRAGAALEQPK